MEKLILLAGCLLISGCIYMPRAQTMYQHNQIATNIVVNQEIQPQLVDQASGIRIK